MIYKLLIPQGEVYSFTHLIIPSICQVNRILRKKTLNLFMAANEFVYECYTTRNLPGDISQRLPLFAGMRDQNRPQADCLSFLKIPKYILGLTQSVLVVFAFGWSGTFFMLRVSVTQSHLSQCKAEILVTCCATQPRGRRLRQRDCTTPRPRFQLPRGPALSYSLLNQIGGKKFIASLEMALEQDRSQRLGPGIPHPMALQIRDLYVVCRLIYDFAGEMWCGGHVKAMLDLMGQQAERGPKDDDSVVKRVMDTTVNERKKEIEIIGWTKSGG
ncbi:hypothetical protein B9Z65_6208 [Elsinoe australis]|uniref:Uncharacterized protein n=1 Tax=Elsinoe australis TaxID=40998 RepID=A0A2P8A7Z7_9PEZI|nr:hypothetical protein B9Z65_6208 [Elsinoe australis]